MALFWLASQSMLAHSGSTDDDVHCNLCWLSGGKHLVGLRGHCLLFDVAAALSKDSCSMHGHLSWIVELARLVVCD